jgi:hypothetical protein
MPEYIRLDRLENPGDDEWLAEVARDYEVPQNPSVFVARGPNDERIAFWIGTDGAGFGAGLAVIQKATSSSPSTSPV